jgi:hypothetical protein
MNRVEPTRLKTRINQSASTVELGLEGKLESALERLKQTLNTGYELRVRSIPNGDDKLSGEVKRDCIHIYEENEDEALKTLIHEFLDYAISKAIEPYKQVTNKLIALVNEEAYKRKEKLVETLSTILASDGHDTSGGWKQ